VFVWKALGKVPTEEVGEVKRSRQSRGFWEVVLNEVKNGNTVT
jgi:hypothetical protein